MGFYHLPYVWQLSQEGKSLVTIAPLITLIPCIILTSFLAKKFEKKPAALGLVTLYIACIIFPNALYVFGAFPTLDAPKLLGFIAAMNGLALASILTAAFFGALSLFAFHQYSLNQAELSEIQSKLNAI